MKQKSSHGAADNARLSSFERATNERRPIADRCEGGRPTASSCVALRANTRTIESIWDVNYRQKPGREDAKYPYL